MEGTMIGDTVGLLTSKLLLLGYSHLFCPYDYQYDCASHCNVALM